MVLEPGNEYGVLTMGNEITEQEAREALNRIVYYCGHIGGRSKARGYDPGCDMVSMAEFAVQELSRRAAERAEREKPIDAEWCVNNGAIEYDAGHELVYGWDLGWCEFNWRENRGCRMYVGDYHFHVNLPQETRGQLLDLLRALKGGAS